MSTSRPFPLFPEGERTENPKQSAVPTDVVVRISGFKTGAKYLEQRESLRSLRSIGRENIS
jgi:hypothetical protein